MNDIEKNIIDPAKQVLTVEQISDVLKELKALNVWKTNKHFGYANKSTQWILEEKVGSSICHVIQKIEDEIMDLIEKVGSIYADQNQDNTSALDQIVFSKTDLKVLHDLKKYVESKQADCMDSIKEWESYGVNLASEIEIKKWQDHILLHNINCFIRFALQHEIVDDNL